VTGHVTAIAKWNAEVSRLVLDDQMVFHAALKRLKPENGEPFEIEAMRLFGRRTSKQNKAYWGWVVRPIALASHQSLDEIHRLLKAEYLPTERLVIADKDTGEVKFEREVECGTTTRMSETDFDRYMEHCRLFGMTHCGIDFSPRGLWEQFGIGEG
jgi:hypothetical protein